MRYESICLFLPSGKTFTFKNITLQLNNQTVLTFLYKAMSDGMCKEMTVYQDRIVGYSLFKPLNDFPLAQDLG